ncbi:hypothetical protein [Paenibacillus macquariensis]|uniref:Uncharacterized protein n=1 Tax=Paenibacillus macquariensis TaxID=948756 RepID=A0ABY1JZG8_9BACL|nr:hypothetical protein [Paenibacillus macquariensis]MEC0091273.1 hypothetical protein [Paenibacillus macquariensis]OAB37967.1 hypothetical protein PMSM_02155 [Paenibacillus macquariensis subsp. macquariensis]SIR03315.1 hypothetical protein SAMN05421578_10679 [Paenibacillus macquariensis]
MLNLTDPLSELKQPELSNFKIGNLEIYQFDCTLIENMVAVHSDKCTCGLFKISSHGIDGWAEYKIPEVQQHFDLIHWASVFMPLRGLSIYEGMTYNQNKTEQWGPVRKTLVESALINLSANLQNPSNSMLLDRSYLFTRSQAYFSF